MNQPLILLFGMPRSGTTWLGKIFDSHPGTLYRHEPDSRGTLNDIPLFAFTKDAEQYHAILKSYIQQMPHNRDEKISASLPIFNKHYYSAPQIMLRKACVYGIKAMSRFLRVRYVPDVVNVANNADVSVVWKSIESLGRLGVIAKNFPNSRNILILRHPCGYVASVLRGESKSKFEGAGRSSDDWGILTMLLELPCAKQQCIDVEMVKAMSPVQRLALKWALYYEHAFTETSALDNVLRLRYEDVCKNPHQEIAKVFEFCHLRPDRQTEMFIGNSTASEKQQYYSVFKDPFVAASKWQKELSSEEISQVMQVISNFQAAKYYEV